MSSKYHYFNIIFIYCNLFVFKSLGLLPWKINLSSLKTHPHSNKDNKKHNETKKLMSVSIWGLIYSVMLIISNYISVRYAMWGVLEINGTSKMPMIIQAVNGGAVILEMFSVTSVWMLYILCRKKVFFISELLMDASRMLNNSIKYNWQVTPRMVFIFSINIGVSIILALAQFTVYDFMFSFSWFISVVTSAWVLIQYALILEVINHQLKMINKEILNFGNIPDNIRKRNVFISKLPMKNDSECHIVNLKYVYVYFWNTFDRLSSFYAIPVILSVTFFGLIVTFTAYYNFYKFLVIRSLSLGHDICDAMWFVIIASPIITLITVVNDIKKEISIIPDRIHWLLNFCSMSEEMENALIEFSNDLLGRKVNFSAYGIIPLDGSLLFSILGSSITYMVILIQYQLQSDSSKLHSSGDNILEIAN